MLERRELVACFALVLVLLGAPSATGHDPSPLASFVEASAKVAHVSFPLTSGDSSRILHASFALITASLKNSNDTFRLDRVAAVEEDVLEDVDAYPEEEESSSEGIVRFVCGGAEFLSQQRASDVVLADANHLPVYLVPLQDEPDHSVYQLARVILHSAEAAQDSASLQFLLLVSSSLAPREGLLAATELDSCLIEFIDPERQDAKPAGVYRTSSGAAVIGRLPMTSEESPAVARTAAAFSQESVQEALDLLHELVCPGTTRSKRAGGKRGSTVAKGEPTSLLTEDTFVPMTVTELLQTRGVDAAATAMLTPIIKPLLDPVTGILLDSMGFNLAPTWGATLEAGMSDIVPLVLSRKISAPLGQLLVPSLAETVTDTLPPLVAQNLKTFLTFVLTNRITKAVTTRLNATLSVSIPAQVDRAAPKRMDQHTQMFLGHILTRSVAHTVVPALVHTFTHSPLQDYYCYYCFHHNEYCKFCVYSPIQNYYAQIYAGHYSTWYSDYYTDYYRDIMAQERGREDGKAVTHKSKGPTTVADAVQRGEQERAGQDVNGVQQEIILEPPVKP